VAPNRTKRWWDEFGEQAAANGWDIGRGGSPLPRDQRARRPHHRSARRTARDPHDEWIKFLSPYGRFREYAMPDGSPAPFDHQPPLEDSIDQRQMAIGSVEEVADVLGRPTRRRGCEHFVMFFDMPGLTREQMDEQLELTATEVLPRLGVSLAS
jgi:hypothetical protein